MNCYILADGFDLEDCAAVITERTKQFLAPYAERTSFIDERGVAPTRSGDYPTWHLGIEFRLEALTPSERKDIILFYHQLSADIGRPFVVGGQRREGEESEDWHFIDANEPIDPVLEFVTDKK